uniref:Uncharacterized protein n=1 Tax=Anopheles dirus TaxID=7168 RepID=A0A182MYN3_9DIPT
MLLRLHEADSLLLLYLCAPDAMLHGVRGGHHLSRDRARRVLRCVPQPRLGLGLHHNDFEQPPAESANARRLPGGKGINMGLLKVSTTMPPKPLRTL